MPSNIELSGIETGLFNIMSREYVLRNYINTVKQDYDGAVRRDTSGTR